MSLGLDANRLAIDRVYLNECTVEAFQERARLENKREALQELMSDIDMCIVESDAWLLRLRISTVSTLRKSNPKKTHDPTQ